MSIHKKSVKSLIRLTAKLESPARKKLSAFINYIRKKFNEDSQLSEKALPVRDTLASYEHS
jgi:hypothetical protein